MGEWFRWLIDKFFTDAQWKSLQNLPLPVKLAFLIGILAALGLIVVIWRKIAGREKETSRGDGQAATGNVNRQSQQSNSGGGPQIVSQSGPVIVDQSQRKGLFGEDIATIVEKTIKAAGSKKDSDAPSEGVS